MSGVEEREAVWAVGSGVCVVRRALVIHDMSASPCSSGIPVYSMSESSRKNSVECDRSTLNAAPQTRQNSAKAGESRPPMTAAKSGVNTKGARSRFIPNFDLKLPRKWPKSMWKRLRGGRSGWSGGERLGLQG